MTLPAVNPVQSLLAASSAWAPLAARLAAEVVIVTQDGREAGVRRLGAAGIDLPDTARVALVVTDPFLFIRLLVALDGRVAAILLLSYGLPGDQVTHLVRAAGCDTVLTDRADLLGAALDGVAVLAAETALIEAAQSGIFQNTLWLLTTSGTTGLPKIVSHHLTALAGAVRPPRPGDPQPVWGHVIDPARLAGVLVMLQALVGGGRLVVADPGASLALQIAGLAAGGVTHLSCTPTLWRRILMLPDYAALRLSQITLGGETADTATLRALSVAWPAARISHIYASTEAGQGFSVTDGRAGFPAAWLKGAPGGLAGGLGLAIRDGVLWLQPPLQARGASRTGPRIGIEADAQGFIRTGDLVEIQGDIEGGRVMFLGRESGLINVAGVKVWPEVVEAVIKAVPGVGLVQIFARKSPVTGALVVAEVQLVEGADPVVLKPLILAACRAGLPREAVPASIRFVVALATNAAGKLLRPGPKA